MERQREVRKLLLMLLSEKHLSATLMIASCNVHQCDNTYFYLGFFQRWQYKIIQIFYQS